MIKDLSNSLDRRATAHIGAIEVEDTSTWPRHLYETALANMEVLVAYQRERERIDTLYEDDVSHLVNPPGNPHLAAYSTLVADLDAILAGHTIIGYHCTRLTREEIRDIRQNGLQVLSSVLLERRLEMVLHRGLLSPEQYRYISGHSQLRSNLANGNGNRTGMIYFCPNRSTLAVPSAVCRLFRSWGGEALYCGLETDLFVGAKLRAIGKPCVVKCHVPIAEVRPLHFRIAERLTSYLVSGKIDLPEPPPSFSFSIDRSITGAEVIDIFKAGEPVFEELTRWKTWSVRYRIVGS